MQLSTQLARMIDENEEMYTQVCHIFCVILGSHGIEKCLFSSIRNDVKHVGKFVLSPYLETQKGLWLKFFKPPFMSFRLNLLCTSFVIRGFYTLLHIS